MKAACDRASLLGKYKESLSKLQWLLCWLPYRDATKVLILSPIFCVVEYIWSDLLSFLLSLFFIGDKYFSLKSELGKKYKEDLTEPFSCSCSNISSHHVIVMARNVLHGGASEDFFSSLKPSIVILCFCSRHSHISAYEDQRLCETLFSL